MPLFEVPPSNSSHKLLRPTLYVTLSLTASLSPLKDDLLTLSNSPDTSSRSSKSSQMKKLKVPSEQQLVLR
jgi:hypothetical protein